MLENLVAFSVRRRGIVLILWAMLLAAAAMTLPKLSVDAVPDVTNTQVQVLTTAPGLSPAEVERYLTYPIETAMNGVPGVTEIRSVSRTALSVVTVVFDDDTTVWFARQLVAERLKLAENDIPAGMGRPELAPVSTGLGQIYEFYLRSPDGKHSAMELRTLLDWVIAYRLRSVPGVIEVNAMGGDAKQYQVVVDPRKLASYKLTIAKVEEALEKNNAALGGGYIEKNREAYVIRGDAQFKSLADIAETVLTVDDDGTPILVRHVAEVRLGAALPFGAATKLGEGEIVTGTVMMLIGADSLKVVSGVKERLAEIQQLLPEGVEIRPFYDRAEFIGRMLRTVAINLAEGALLVVVVLFLTLGSFRGALIAALAIPLAMGIALIGMVRFGVTGNLMSLGAIDFGLLVDGAIVMLEAALAQLAVRKLAGREDVVEAIASAMRRSARPVAFALAIILLVYLPLMALEGVEGRMFKPMAFTVALALFGALLFSLTAFPAMAAFALEPPKHGHDGHGHDAHHERGVFGRLRRGYRRLLSSALRHPGPILAVAGLAVVLAGAVGSSIGAEFLPRLEEGEISLDVRRLPSIGLAEAKRLGNEVERVLSRFPEVTSVVSRTGRPEVPTDPVGFDEADVRVKLKPKEEWTTAHDLDALGDAIKKAIESEVPATFIAISQPIEDRVNTLLAGSKADVVIKLFGDDLTTLKSTADRVGKALAGVTGTADLRVQRVLGLPLFEVKPDRARLARYGVSADDVLQVVEASRIGRKVGTVFEQQRRFDVMLLLPPRTNTPEGFGDLLIGTPRGQLVPMAQLASLTEAEGPAVIQREKLERRVLVEVNVRGTDLVSYVDAARAAVASVQLPKGVHVEWGGQFENFRRARNRLALVVPVALFLIFGMLFLMFGDARLALAVFAGAPLAVVGGVGALALRGLPFSIPAAVGFIAVAGVAVLNGVVMASEVRRRGLGDRDALVDAAVEVLRPVLTTAAVAAIGFLPMALSHHAGAEVQRPLATVVIGGILSSTVLSLFVLPILLRLLAPKESLVIPPDDQTID
jgi:cobalt-zinc-cadmium resistance protein CzcA